MNTSSLSFHQKIATAYITREGIEIPSDAEYFNSKDNYLSKHYLDKNYKASYGAKANGNFSWKKLGQVLLILGVFGFLGYIVVS